MSKEPRTIDITPTWCGIMPTLIGLIECGNEDARKTAIAELMRLAKCVDDMNEAVKAEKARKASHLD